MRIWNTLRLAGESTDLAQVIVLIQSLLMHHKMLAKDIHIYAGSARAEYGHDASCCDVCAAQSHKYWKCYNMTVMVSQQRSTPYVKALTLFSGEIDNLWAKNQLLLKDLDALIDDEIFDDFDVLVL